MKDAKNINQTLQFSNDILVDIEEKLQIYHVKKKIWFLFRVKYKISGKKKIIASPLKFK